MEHYYVKNLETGKLNVFTTKTFYDGLSDDKKSVFKQFCLWSNKQQCWISKGKADNCYYLKNRLAELGFEDKGLIGKKLSFEEQVKAEQEKAAARAGRSEDRAEKAEQRSGQIYDEVKKMASVIPFGQPILVGHHSEGRDRRYRDRIHNKFGKAFEEMDKAAYYSGKAENARYTAEGKKYANPAYLSRRIRECEKNLRLLGHRLEGKWSARSTVQEISEESRAFYNGRIKEEQEKLDFFIDKMKAVTPGWEYEPPKGKNKHNGKSCGL